MSICFLLADFSSLAGLNCKHCKETHRCCLTCITLFTLSNTCLSGAFSSPDHAPAMVFSDNVSGLSSFAPRCLRQRRERTQVYGGGETQTDGQTQEKITGAQRKKNSDEFYTSSHRLPSFRQNTQSGRQNLRSSPARRPTRVPSFSPS